MGRTSEASVERMSAAEWFARGQVSLMDGHLDDAAASFRQALERDSAYVPAWLELAEVCRRQQRWAEAERCLLEACRLEPDQTKHLQRLTGFLSDQGRLDDAASLLRQALQALPDDGALHHSLGFVLASQGQLTPAEQHFRRAIERLPDAVDTLRNLALCLSQQGKHGEVLDVSRRIVELKPDIAAHWHELGRVQRRLKKFADAITSLEKALQLAPDSADVHHDLALTLTDHGDARRAEAAYRRSLELRPDFVEALNNLGVLLEGQGKVDEAIQLLRRAVEIKNAPDLWNNLGVAVSSKRDFTEAIRCYRRSLALDPNYAAALNNLGNAQRSVGQVDEAILALRQSLRLRPDYAEAYNNLAIALVQSGKHQEAMRYYNQAIHFRPDYAEAHMNRSLDRLATGDFEAGWIEYEWRWRGKQLRLRYADSPRWDGSSPAGKRILIHYEQGLGDTFQFIRYARLLKKLGATVIAEVQKPLVRLLRHCPDLDDVVATGSELPAFDFHAPLMSLPGLLGTTLECIPCDVPYLNADEGLVERWRERLASLPGLKIGIAWQGNPEYRGDRHRSLPLKYFAALARLPGVSLISLQRGFGLEQLAEIAGEFHVTAWEDLDDSSGPFMDTAAIMKNLDLMVTSDTALPHLAGALGVPVWLALPVACDWRWMHGREDSPWYPTMRVFRQRERDQWEDVFERIAAAIPVRFPERRGRETTPSDADQALAESKWQEAIELISAHQLDKAERTLLDAMRLDPQRAKIHHDLGVVRGKQRRPEHAVASFRRALELNPHSASTWGNLGLAFLEQDQIDEAISHLRRALTLGPNAPETFNNLGVAYMRNSQPAFAAENYQRALRLRPDYAEAHLNLSRALLIQGNFAEGWLEYEWRWRCPGYEPRSDEKPRWGGETLGGRTILLHCEQGLGDTLQFVRLAPLVKRGGGTVLLECQPPLARILARCPGIDQVIPRGSPLPAYDVHAPLLSLPSLLGITLAKVPDSVPYLFVEPELVRVWRERLNRIEGFKVGICWQGNRHYDGDRSRSIDLKRFMPLSKVKDVQLISLQKGPGCEQMADLVDRFPLVDLGPEIDVLSGPFMDTAAILLNLDLVVTSDTATAHLAGALGVPVWLALPKSPDFRWLLDRGDSPWYPSMRIFRQQVRGQWDEVFQRISKSLEERVSTVADQTPPPTLAAEIEAKSLHEEARRLLQQGHTTGAATHLKRALQANPDFTAAHLDLGVVLARLRQFDQAIPHLRRAIQLAPHQVAGYANLGLALLESSEAAEAASVLESGIRLAPESANLYKHLGMAQANLGRYPEAIAALEQAVKLQPDSADLHFQLGGAFHDAGRSDKALLAYQRALQLRPDMAEAFNQIGVIQARLGRNSEAVASYQAALRVRADYAEAYNNLAVSLADLHQLEDAVAAFQQALYLRPEDAATHRNYGLALLLQGKLETGWLEYEWRWRCKEAAGGKRTAGPRWNGAPLQGRTLLITPEQGLGDTIQFVRYARVAKQCGARVAVMCQRPLVPLLSRYEAIDELVAEGDPLPPFDVHSPMLSLPFGFRTTLDTIPADVPYLAADVRLVDQWREFLRPHAGFKIGIAWQGSRTYAGDAARSISLHHFSALASVPGVELFSLQKGFGQEQLASWRGPHPILVPEPLDESAGAFMDTAAIMMSMDLVITSDSAIAHLAGALGLPVWVALCRSSDWRWMRERDDSPWYPTMRLFRQDASGEWAGVFRHMAELLRQRLHA